MSKVKVTAIDSVNGFNPGEQFEVSEREARQMEEKGLVKMLGAVQNKMAPAPANKANPSKAAGEAPKSPASRAAQASKKTTAKKSVAGKPKTPAAGA